MKRVIVFAVIILLIILAIDFVRFNNAVHILKSDIPIKGFDTAIVFPSYKPFFWGRPVAGFTYRSMGNEEVEKPLYVHFRIGEHRAVTVWTNGENWFDYEVPVRNDDERRNEWYEQEYHSLTGYVKILSYAETHDKDFNRIINAKIFYYIETDTQKIYFAIQNIVLKRGGCDGGYWYGTLGTPY